MTIPLWTVKHNFTMLENSNFHSTKTPSKTEELSPTKFSIISLTLIKHYTKDIYLAPGLPKPWQWPAGLSDFSWCWLQTKPWPGGMSRAALQASLQASHYHKLCHRAFLLLLQQHVFPPPHLNSLHTTSFSKAASHQKIPSPGKCLLLNYITAKVLQVQTVKFLQLYLQVLYCGWIISCQQLKDDGIFFQPFYRHLNQL